MNERDFGVAICPSMLHMRADLTPEQRERLFKIKDRENALRGVYERGGDIPVDPADRSDPLHPPSTCFACEQPITGQIHYIQPDGMDDTLDIFCQTCCPAAEHEHTA